MTMTEIRFIKVFIFTVDSKQKKQKRKSKYHGNLIACKSQPYLKPGSPIFLLFG